jgi:hypothetical protein
MIVRKRHPYPLTASGLCSSLPTGVYLGLRSAYYLGSGVE